MGVSLPVLCGVISTIIFVIGTLPMLVKAGRTRDLSSYSLSNLLMSNLGNALNSVYVFSLPAGPLWALHGFYVVTTALMLVWYLRYRCVAAHKSPSPQAPEMDSSPDATDAVPYLTSR